MVFGLFVPADEGDAEMVEPMNVCARPPSASNLILFGFRGHPEASFELEVLDGTAGNEDQAAFLHGGLQTLELQLPSPLQVRALCGGLVGASPERPGDDVRGADAPLDEAGGDAADLLDRSSDEGGCSRGSRGALFGGGARFARWRTRASMAKATMTSGTWRCQTCQERVSSWSRPSSVLAVSKASSMA